MTDLDKLEELAKAATSGPRRQVGRKLVKAGVTLDPATVLALVAECRELRRLKGALEFLSRNRNGARSQAGSGANWVGAVTRLEGGHVSDLKRKEYASPPAWEEPRGLLGIAKRAGAVRAADDPAAGGKLDEALDFYDKVALPNHLARIVKGTPFPEAPAEPEQAGKVQRVELLVQVVEWLYERGHRDAAVDMDCNWNDAPPGDETCRRLTEYLPAPPTKEGT